MKILVLDNYDSFTYNLVHQIEAITNNRPDVFRNNEIELGAINNYQKIILSPGPGLPNEAGIMPELIKAYASTKSIFGVCLGFQAIAEFAGCSLYNLPEVYHGVASTIHIKQSHYLFNHCPQKIKVGRYHSWVVNKNLLSGNLIISAEDEKGEIMAGHLSTYYVCGVQFHPESILTEYGQTIMRNFLIHDL